MYHYCPPFSCTHLSLNVCWCSCIEQCLWDSCVPGRVCACESQDRCILWPAQSQWHGWHGASWLIVGLSKNSQASHHGIWGVWSGRIPSVSTETDCRRQSLGWNYIKFKGFLIRIVETKANNCSHANVSIASHCITAFNLIICLSSCQDKVLTTRFMYSKQKVEELKLIRFTIKGHVTWST